MVGPRGRRLAIKNNTHFPSNHSVMGRLLLQRLTKPTIPFPTPQAKAAYHWQAKRRTILSQQNPQSRPNRPSTTHPRKFTCRQTDRILKTGTRRPVRSRTCRSCAQALLPARKFLALRLNARYFAPLDTQSKGSTSWVSTSFTLLLILAPLDVKENMDRTSTGIFPVAGG